MVTESKFHPEKMCPTLPRPLKETKGLKRSVLFIAMALFSFYTYNFNCKVE